MKKNIYNKLFSHLIYTWIFVCIFLLSIIVQLYWLEMLINKEYKLYQQQLKLINFTFRTELVRNRLTDNIRFFSYTFNPEFLGNYLQELKKVKKIDDYVLFLKNLKSSPAEINILLQAKALADTIREPELKSIKLMLMAYNVNEEIIPPEVKFFQLSPEESALSKQEKTDLAIKLLQAESYIDTKQKILILVRKMRDAVLTRTSQSITIVQNQIAYLWMSLMFSTVICLIIILWIIWFRRLSLKKWLS